MIIYMITIVATDDNIYDTDIVTYMISISFIYWISFLQKKNTIIFNKLVQVYSSYIYN